MSVNKGCGSFSQEQNGQMKVLSFFSGTLTPRVSIDVENMGRLCPPPLMGVGGLFRIWWGGGGLKSIHGESMGDLKCCQITPVKEFIW